MPLSGNISAAHPVTYSWQNNLQEISLLGAMETYAGNGNGKSESQGEHNKSLQVERGGVKEDAELFKDKPEKQDCLDDISRKKITWDTSRRHSKMTDYLVSAENQ